MPRIRSALLGLAAGVLTFGGISGASGQSADSPRRIYFDVPIQVQSPVRPQPFRGDDGRACLVYHLFITNWGIGELTFDRLEFLDADSGGLGLLRTGDRELTTACSVARAEER